MFSVATKVLTVLLQLLTIRFKLLPGDVAHMDILEEKWPCFLRHRLHMQRTVQPFARMGSSITERPSIARIPQNFQHAIVCHGEPMDRSSMRAGTNTVWKEKLLVPEILHCGPGRRCRSHRSQIASERRVEPDHRHKNGRTSLPHSPTRLATAA